MFVNKTYKCPIHGEFEHWCDTNDPELTKCYKDKAEIDHNADIALGSCKPYEACGESVTRVFKPTHYSFKCDGFCGKGFD